MTAQLVPKRPLHDHLLAGGLTMALFLAVPLSTFLLWGASAGKASAALGEESLRQRIARTTALRACASLPNPADRIACKRTIRASFTPPVRVNPHSPITSRFR